MKKKLKILLLLDIFFMVSAGLLGPVYAIYVKDIGGSILDIGWSWAAFSIFAGIFTLVMGKIEEKKDKIKMTIIGYGMKIFCFMGYLFVAEPIHLLIVQMFLGISTAISVPAYDALFSKYLEKGKESFEWGVWESSNYIFSAIAAVIGVSIVEFFGFHTLFLSMIFLAAFGLFSFIYMVKKIKQW